MDVIDWNIDLVAPSTTITGCPVHPSPGSIHHRPTGQLIAIEKVPIVSIHFFLFIGFSSITDGLIGSWRLTRRWLWWVPVVVKVTCRNRMYGWSKRVAQANLVTNTARGRSSSRWWSALAVPEIFRPTRWQVLPPMNGSSISPTRRNLPCTRAAAIAASRRKPARSSLRHHRIFPEVPRRIASPLLQSSSCTRFLYSNLVSWFIQNCWG